MLHFTRTTFVNDASNVCVYDGLLKSDGSKGKKFAIKFGDTLYSDEEHCIKVVGYQPYKEAQFAKATIDLAGLDAEKTYRIAVYVRLRNNNSSMYSNTWTFKGKPLFVEFAGDCKAEDVANIVKKFQLFEYGKNLITATPDGDSLVLEATDQWQMFMDQNGGDAVQLQSLEEVKSGEGCHDVCREEWQVVKDATVEVDNGNEAFGDFAHLVKDLRLPTAANLRWQGTAMGDVFGGEPNDDIVNPTGKYHQVSVQYDSERGILQQTAVGGLGRSRTMHIFFVEDAAVESFLAQLTEAGALNVPAKDAEELDEKIYTEANSSDLGTAEHKAHV